MTLLTTEFLPTKTYPFQTLRYAALQDPMQDGVWGGTDFLVVQRAAGANMSVDVGAGGAWINGGDVARQGLYHQVNDASLNVAIAAADPSNPRVDSLYLKVNDTSIVGSSDNPALTVVQGTPTAGAQVTNPGGANYRAGAAAQPTTSLRLADILVPAAAGSIVTANIQDRRRWARGAYAQKSRTADIALVGTAAAQKIDATNLQCLIECTGLAVLRCTLRAYLSQTQNTDFMVFQNGFVVSGANGGGFYRDSRGNGMVVGVWDVLTGAGLQQMAAGWAAPNAATSNLLGTTSAAQGMYFTVEEISRQNQANG